MTTKNTRTRRGFLKTAGAAVAAGSVAPYVWLKNAKAKQTVARGGIKHLLYIRLRGGFRFPAAFNADVGNKFNPFGSAESKAEGCDWGVSSLLERAGWLNDDLAALGMRPVNEIANQMTVLPCVDHEPLSGSADGNHQTGLERYYTGYVNGPVGFFTMINYGLRERIQQAQADGEVQLPAFVLGGSGMGKGLGKYAAYRPPVLSGSGFDQFGFDSDAVIPDWALTMAGNMDSRYKERLMPQLRYHVDGYQETRKATTAYAEIFSSDALKIGNNNDDLLDGISNRQLREMFGNDGTARDVRLALRLFHFGCPAIYLDQGGYDMHSGEENGLPGRIEGLNRMVSGLEAALKLMTHPEGGSYWDHTLVVLGSEFSRTARGERFNSARGSDHSGDRSTRWMSMPFMGGVVGRPGAMIGQTRAEDLQAMGPVFSYRSVLKTLLDGLGCDHAEFFPADDPFDDLFLS